MDIDKQKLRELCERADDCSLNIEEWNELSSSVPDLLGRIDELEAQIEAADAVTGDNDAALVEITNENRQLRAQLEARGVDDAMVTALKRSITAIDDWLNVYASELCDEDRVKEAIERLDERGTLAYIANVQQQNRAALEAALAVPAQQWRPISEAKHDGTDYILSTRDEIIIGRYTTRLDRVYDLPVTRKGWWSGDKLIEPTHFMPLPAPPAQEDK